MTDGIVIENNIICTFAAGSVKYNPCFDKEDVCFSGKIALL